MFKNLKNVIAVKKAMWESLRSPRTVALLKLGAAVIGVIHAIDELRSAPSVGKMQIGFRPDED